MKTIKSPNLKLTIISLAIAINTTSFKPANAQRSRVLLPEIGYSSRLSSMGLNEFDNIGKSYSFYCQPALDDLIHAPVWGTSIYTVNSGICSTAVHSGLITKEEGGNVTIELLEGQEFYTGSHKNDVISKDHRTTDMSFTFIGEPEVPNSPAHFNSRQQQHRSSGIERVVVNGVQRGVQRSIENVLTDLFD